MSEPTAPRPMPELPDASTVVKKGGAFARDIIERVVATFVMTTAALLAAAGPADLLDLGFWKAAGVAGFAAALTLVKGLVARGIGERNSAAAVSGV